MQSLSARYVFLEEQFCAGGKYIASTFANFHLEDYHAMCMFHAEDKEMLLCDCNQFAIGQLGISKTNDLENVLKNILNTLFEKQGNSSKYLLIFNNVKKDLVSRLMEIIEEYSQRVEGQMIFNIIFTMHVTNSDEKIDLEKSDNVNFIPISHTIKNDNRIINSIIEKHLALYGINIKTNNLALYIPEKVKIYPFALCLYLHWVSGGLRPDMLPDAIQHVFEDYRKLFFDIRRRNSKEDISFRIIQSWVSAKNGIDIKIILCFCVCLHIEHIPENLLKMFFKNFSKATYSNGEPAFNQGIKTLVTCGLLEKRKSFDNAYFCITPLVREAVKEFFFRTKKISTCCPYNGIVKTILKSDIISTNISCHFNVIMSCVKECVNLCPDDRELKKEIVNFSYKVLNCLLENGNYIKVKSIAESNEGYLIELFKEKSLDHNGDINEDSEGNLYEEDLYILLGRISCKNNEIDKAKKHYARAEELLKNNKDEIKKIQLKLYQITLHHNEANINLSGSDEYKTIINELEELKKRLEELKPCQKSDLEINMLRVEICNALGNAICTKKTEEALEYYNQAFQLVNGLNNNDNHEEKKRGKIQCKLAKAYMKLGYAYYCKEEYPRALTELSESIRHYKNLNNMKIIFAYIDAFKAQYMMAVFTGDSKLICKARGYLDDAFSYEKEHCESSISPMVGHLCKFDIEWNKILQIYEHNAFDEEVFMKQASNVVEEHKKILELIKKIFGEKHLEYILAKVRLGMVCLADNKYSESITYLEQAKIEMCEIKKGDCCPFLDQYIKRAQSEEKNKSKMHLPDTRCAEKIKSRIDVSNIINDGSYSPGLVENESIFGFGINANESTIEDSTNNSSNPVNGVINPSALEYLIKTRNQRTEEINFGPESNNVITYRQVVL